MAIWDWLGPIGTGWANLPAVEQKRAPDFVPADAQGIVVILNRLVQTPAPYDTGRGADGNSAAFACLQVLATAIGEPQLTVYRESPAGRVEVENSPLGDLLARPNPYFSMDVLLGYLCTSLHVDGNAYWRKLRAGDPETGNVVELWPISSSNIEPITRPGSTDFVSFYRYTSGNGRPEEISPSNIVHFRYGLDDSDHRLGCAPLKRLVREISSDQQATRYADRLLANLAINGLTLSFDKDSPAINQATADELKARIQAAYGGDNAGAAAVLSPGATLTALGFSPEQMDMKTLHRVPEERIAAVLGVPAIVAGLGAGLDHATYSNAAQARELFTEQKLLPLWKRIAADLTIQLVPDFSTDRSVVVEFDTSEVRALATDQNEAAVRLKTLIEAGVITVDEARAEIGLEPMAQPIAVDASGAASRRIVALDTRSGHNNALRASSERKAASDLPDDYARLRDDELPTWEREILLFLEQQLRRITRRLRAGADTASELVTEGEAILLGETLTPLQLRLLGEVERLVIAELGIEFQLDDPQTRAYLRDAGQNIGGITDTTRGAVQDALIEGQMNGEGIDQLARRLRDLPAFTDARARMVARTELGHAQVQASLSNYRASGVVVGVTILDGDYDAPCAARNGTKLPLDRAGSVGLLHPNCTMSLSPLTSADDLVSDPGRSQASA